MSLEVYRIMTRDAVSPCGVGMSHTLARNYVMLTRGDVALVSDGTARGRTRAVAVRNLPHLPLQSNIASWVL